MSTQQRQGEGRDVTLRDEPTVLCMEREVQLLNQSHFTLPTKTTLDRLLTAALEGGGSPLLLKLLTKYQPVARYIQPRS